MGKVHGSLARAGKVKKQTPKVAKAEKPKPPVGRAKKRPCFLRQWMSVAKGTPMLPLLSIPVLPVRNRCRSSYKHAPGSADMSL